MSRTLPSTIPAPSFDSLELEAATRTIPRLRVPCVQLVAPASHWAISFPAERRCLGFAASHEHAQALVQVFGEGAMIERLAGPYPSNHAAAAADYEQSLAELILEPENDNGRTESVDPFPSNVARLRLVENEAATLELAPEELDVLRDALAPKRPALRLIRGGLSV